MIDLGLLYGLHAFRLGNGFVVLCLLFCCLLLVMGLLFWKFWI